MSTISTSDFTAIADSIAKQKELLESALGDTTDADTILYGAQQNLDRVLQLNDYEQEKDLLAGANKVIEDAAADRLASNFLSQLANDLASHVGGLNSYLEENSIKVDTKFADVARGVKNDYIFGLVIGTVELDGAGSATFTDGASIETNDNIILEVINQGASSTDVTITLEKADGTTEDKTVTVSSGASAGTTLDVGTHDTDMYVDVNAVSVTGGESGDKYEIKTEIKRSISL